MKKSELEFVKTVANLTGLCDSVVLDVLETAGDVVADLLAQPLFAQPAEEARVPGFGKFTAHRGDIIVEHAQLPPRLAVRFVPAKSFRRMLEGKR